LEGNLTAFDEFKSGELSEKQAVGLGTWKLPERFVKNREKARNLCRYNLKNTNEITYNFFSISCESGRPSHYFLRLHLLSES
jgi:hypothetical protein